MAEPIPAVPAGKQTVLVPETKKTAPSYQNIRGQKIFKAKGNPIPEVDKILTPVDAEELELCEYFANLGNLKKIKLI